MSLIQIKENEMKKLIFAILFLTVSVAFGYEIKSVDGKVMFAKWTYRTPPAVVWTDEEKAYLIATTTATEADFKSIYPDQKILDIANEISLGGKWLSRSEWIAEIEKRNTKDYCVNQMIANNQKIADLVSLSKEKGIDVSVTTKTLTTENAKVWTRYQNAPTVSIGE
jgi:hypothetical protein